MRLTSKLYAQHIGWMFKKHWQIQGKRVPRDTGAIAELAKHGFEVKNPFEVLKKPHSNPYLNFNISKQNESDAIAETECYLIGNNTVFVEGIQQAQVLTKTIVVNEFPEQIADAISKIQISNLINKNVQNSILSSHVFDAQQEKTAIVKVPERPAYVLPRNFGILDSRKNRLIISKLLFECEKLAGKSISLQRKIIDDAKFEVFVTKDNETIKFDVLADTLVLSKRPLQNIKESYKGEIPDLFPMKFTIGVPLTNAVSSEFHPISNRMPYWPHTAFGHYSPEDIKNLYETPVTNTQFEGRTLLKAFAVAASKAKHLYGNDVKDLQKPIVVQSIQTDGKTFHFGIFQLNTLNLDEDNATTNYWFHVPGIQLFNVCEYQLGRPVLEEYNNEVVKTLSVFYNNS